MKYQVLDRIPHVPGRATLLLDCEKGCGTPKGCRFSLGPQRIEGNMTWQWDGNKERPTISPSIFCHGGCNRHFNMTDGTPNPA